jgi:hypothetical protein
MDDFRWYGSTNLLEPYDPLVLVYTKWGGIILDELVQFTQLNKKKTTCLNQMIHAAKNSLSVVLYFSKRIGVFN